MESRITKIVPKPVATTYQLTVTQEELDYLTSIVGRTTGDVFDQLYSELSEHREVVYDVKDKQRPDTYVTLTFHPA